MRKRKGPLLWDWVEVWPAEPLGLELRTSKTWLWSVCSVYVCVCPFPLKSVELNILENITI